MERIDIYKAFFTEESRYYASCFERFELNKKFSFNFYAGLFGLIWYCYRKLYKQAVILFFIFVLFGLFIWILLLLINPHDNMNRSYVLWIMVLVRFVILGFASNYVYFNKSKKIVEPFIEKYQLENIDNKMLK